MKICFSEKNTIVWRADHGRGWIRGEWRQGKLLGAIVIAQ